MSVEDFDLNSYLPIFIEESKEYIQQISENLLRLEQEVGDTEAINEIFRGIHTLKGMSATMGYSEISQLAHKAENILDAVRHDQAAVSSAMITGFFRIVDEFEAQLLSLEETGEPSPIPAPRLQELLNSFAEPETEPPAEPQPETYHLEVFFSRDCLLPQARAMIVCNQLKSVGKLLHTAPSQESLPNLPQLEKLQCWISSIRPDQVRALLDGAVEIENYTIEMAAGQDPGELESIPDQEGSEGSEARADSQLARHTIRVDTEKLDQLLNLVSELVINKTALQQTTTTYPLIGDGVEHLHRLTSELQTIVMKMRMIPLETVFNRFPRMVRDAAISLNKLVNFEIHGSDTELDRSIIEDIADPLVHLLRNAVDHGIETVEQRLAKGKPRTGTVTLRAYQTGNQVIIQVSDDGRGLDLEHIRAKAQGLHLLAGHEQEPEALANLIFSPGFSTAENVTDLSGRGVGLDVVKNSIETLGGSIEVLFQANAGTTFKISLPLTLAIIQGLLVQCGQEIYAIPLSFVAETGIFFPEDVRTVGQQEIIMLRGKVLPIIYLREVLQTKSASDPDELSLVIVRYGDRQIGLVVDDLLAQQEIVIKNINWGQQYFRAFLGCSILGDGSVVMILDINVLLSVVKVRGEIHA